MFITILVSDCLRKGLIEPYFEKEDVFIFRNHWSLHGFTGPSFINIALSQTKTDYPSNIFSTNYGVFVKRQKGQHPLSHARSYPPNAKSFCLEFQDSMFITQHPSFNSIDGQDKVAKKFVFMSYEENPYCWRLTDIVKVGVRYLKMMKLRSVDDVVLFIWSVETHGNPRRKHFGLKGEDLAIKKSVKYTANVIHPLIETSDIFMLTSDHGETYIPKHGNLGEWGHPDGTSRKTHPSQFTIPWFIWGIGKGEYKKETTLLDIAPTICYLAGKPIPKRFEGKVVKVDEN